MGWVLWTARQCYRVEEEEERPLVEPEEMLAEGRSRPVEDQLGHPGQERCHENWPNPGGTTSLRSLALYILQAECQRYSADFELAGVD